MSDIRPERPWRSLVEWGGDPELLTVLESLRVRSGGDDIGRVARVDRIEANVVTAQRLVRVTDGGHGPLGVGDWVTLTSDRAQARPPGAPPDAGVTAGAGTPAKAGIPSGAGSPAGTPASTGIPADTAATRCG